MTGENNTFIIPAEGRLDKHLASKAIDYIEEASELYGSLSRHCFMQINHHVFANKQDLNKHLQEKGYIKTRTANSIITDMQGRHKALGELKKVELEDLEEKIRLREERLGEDRETVNQMKILVSRNLAPSEEYLEVYRSLKRRVWQSGQKLNSMKERRKKLQEEIDSETCSICFGTKKLFREQYTLEESGWENHEQWREEWISRRHAGMFYVARKEETNGNQQFHLKHHDKNLFDFEILHHDKDCRVAAKGRIRMPYMTEELKYQLQLHEKDDSMKQPMSVRLVKRGKGWYLQVLLNVREVPIHSADRSKGVIGVDFNQGFLSVSETDAKGNLIATRDILIPHMGEDRKKGLYELRCSVKEIVQEAGLKQKPVAVEGLNFRKKKSQCVKGHGNRYNRMLHGLPCSAFFEAMERRCLKDGVELIPVNPAYTSQGAKKYLNKKKLTIHRGAAWMIARKAMGFKIRVKKSPKQTEHEKSAREIRNQKNRQKKKTARLVKKKIALLNKQKKQQNPIV